jgi:hypothetical protein
MAAPDSIRAVATREARPTTAAAQEMSAVEATRGEALPKSGRRERAQEIQRRFERSAAAAVLQLEGSPSETRLQSALAAAAASRK